MGMELGIVVGGGVGLWSWFGAFGRERGKNGGGISDKSTDRNRGRAVNQFRGKKGGKRREDREKLLQILQERGLTYGGERKFGGETESGVESQPVRVGKERYDSCVMNVP